MTESEARFWPTGRGWASSRAGGAATPTCEAEIKAETQATIRCLPLEHPGGSGPCVWCGKTGTSRAIFAKAY